MKKLCFYFRTNKQKINIKNILVARLLLQEILIPITVDGGAEEGRILKFTYYFNNMLCKV